MNAESKRTQRNVRKTASSKTMWHCRTVDSRVNLNAAPPPDTTQLSLDPNTAHRDLTISEGNRHARRWITQPTEDLPERFDFWTQVLCVEGLKHRCYWETELTGRVQLGVAYGRMHRKGEGDDCHLGRNDSSWGMSCTKNGYNAWHNGVNIALTVAPCFNRVGVYLDWSAGTLTFYSVFFGVLTPLHTFHASFTEPLYPAFRLGWVNATVRLCWGKCLMDVSLLLIDQQMALNLQWNIYFSKKTFPLLTYIRLTVCPSGNNNMNNKILLILYFWQSISLDHLLSPYVHTNGNIIGNQEVFTMEARERQLEKGEASFNPLNNHFIISGPKRHWTKQNLKGACLWMRG